MAFAAVKNFVTACVVGGKASLPATFDTVLDKSTTAGKASAFALRRKTLAVANLTIALTTEGLMGLMYKAMTPAYPGGLAHLVVSYLFKKYQPQDTISRVELRMMLAGIKMKKNEDPSVLFDQISGIEARHNTATKKIDEEDLIGRTREEG